MSIWKASDLVKEKLQSQQHNMPGTKARGLMKNGGFKTLKLH